MVRVVYCPAFPRKALACPPVVRIGISQTVPNLETGASEYGQTGPKNTSSGEGEEFDLVLGCILSKHSRFSRPVLQCSSKAWRGAKVELHSVSALLTSSLQPGRMSAKLLTLLDDLHPVLANSTAGRTFSNWLWYKRLWGLLGVNLELGRSTETRTTREEESDWQELFLRSRLEMVGNFLADKAFTRSRRGTRKAVDGFIASSVLCTVYGHSESFVTSLSYLTRWNGRYHLPEALDLQPVGHRRHPLCLQIIPP